MYNTFQMLGELLTARERGRALLLFMMMLAVALLETLGVASVMPFIAVLANPEIVETNRILARAYELSGVDTSGQFLRLIGFGVFLLLITSLCFKLLTQWAQVSYSQNRVHDISCRLMERYLSQPYDWFVQRHSSRVATTILSEVSYVVTGALFPALRMLTSALVALFLIVLLLILEPILALILAVSVGSSYVIIYLVVRRRLAKIGQLRLEANRARFRVVNESFRGIKDVKIAGLESTMMQRYRGPTRTMVQQYVRASVIEMVPSFAMQGLIFGGMLLVLLYLMTVHGDIAGALPVFATFAFAGYKLMPALQQVYGNLSQLRATDASLKSLLEDLRTLPPKEATVRDGGVAGSTGRLPLERELRLAHVTYFYPGTSEPALKDISLTVPARQTIGLVGTTGCGKTTTIDVILGLLTPQEGQLLIDDEPIDESNVRRWQRAVGYVPQDIYLSDESVAGNIAFGIPAKQVDMDAVITAAKTANLHAFVTQDLPQQYDTLIGERGVRLSGGQRQRIGIARALYHDPDVLLLDEATSALDNLTESEVMGAVANLGTRKTIIIIAHRLSTVRECDCIYLLEKGRVVGSGTYEQLVQDNPRFQAMASRTV